MAEPKFCPQCGSALEVRQPDDRVRPVCPACGWVYYAQRKVCAAVIVLHQAHIVMLRRTRPPYPGAWGLPAGFVEADETPEQAARREVLEETGLAVDIGPLLGVYPFDDDPRGPGLLHTYLARVTDPSTTPSPKQGGELGIPHPPPPSPTSGEGEQSFIISHQSSVEGEPRWFPLTDLPTELVGAGQSDALRDWQRRALHGGGEVRFCTRCGSAIEMKLLHGRPRPQCPVCGLVQFREPKTTTGVLITDGARVLLARRGVDPGKGLWYLPSGYVDWDERVDEAAVREMQEETGLAVQITGLFGVFTFGSPQAGYGTFILYRGHVVGGALHPDDDVVEVGYFGPDNIPPLAFDTSKLAVAQWIEESTNLHQSTRNRD